MTFTAPASTIEPTFSPEAPIARSANPSPLKSDGVAATGAAAMTRVTIGIADESTARTGALTSHRRDLMPLQRACGRNVTEPAKASQRRGGDAHSVRRPEPSPMLDSPRLVTAAGRVVPVVEDARPSEAVDD